LSSFDVDRTEPEALLWQAGYLTIRDVATQYSGQRCVPWASIPHDWHRNNPLAQYEVFYASVFYSHLAALGLDARVEDATNKGRIDLALLFGDRVYLFEFKVVEQVPEGRAVAGEGLQAGVARFHG
jgi:hypothetical protein